MRRAFAIATLISLLTLACLPAALPPSPSDAGHPDATAAHDAQSDVDSAPGGDAITATDAATADAATTTTPDATTDPGDGAAAIAPADWCAALATTRCATDQRCPLAGVAPVDEDSCVAAQLQRCGAEQLETLVARGRLAFAAAAARDCLAALDTVECNDWLRLAGQVEQLPACVGVLQGLRDADADCVSQLECRSGRCLLSDQCPGRCSSVVDEAQSCDMAHSCAPGSAACVDGRCELLPDAIGSACPDGVCARPLACLSEGTVDQWVCSELGLAGEPCGPGGRVCHPALLCWRSDLIGGGVCAAFRAEGQSCHRHGDCQSDGASRLICSGGSCLPAPGAGAPCEDYLCDRAWCDSSATVPTCRALAGPGEGCLHSSRCASGLFCAGGQCAPRRAVNADCSDDAEACALELRCLAGICAPATGPACALP